VVAISRVLLELIFVRNGSLSLSLGFDLADLNSCVEYLRKYFEYDFIVHINIYICSRSIPSLLFLSVDVNKATGLSKCVSKAKDSVMFKAKARTLQSQGNTTPQSHQLKFLPAQSFRSKLNLNIG